MKKLIVKDLQKKSMKDLVKMRNNVSRELFDARLSNSTKSLNQTHTIKIQRRNIARINTAMSLKQAA